MEAQRVSCVPALPGVNWLKCRESLRCAGHRFKHFSVSPLIILTMPIAGKHVISIVQVRKWSHLSKVTQLSVELSPAHPAQNSLTRSTGRLKSGVGIPGFLVSR